MTFSFIMKKKCASVINVAVMLVSIFKALMYVSLKGKEIGVISLAYNNNLKRCI